MPEYREKQPRTVQALRYDGTFPLDFLDNGETVRATGDGNGSIYVEEPSQDQHRLEVGQWLVRGESQHLTVWSDKHFTDTYEPMPGPPSCQLDSACSLMDGHEGQHYDERDGKRW